MKISKVMKESYYYLNFMTTLLYVNAIIGLFNINPEYAELINSAFILIVSVLLVIYFNPLRTKELTEFHRKLGFSAGLSLITTAGTGAFMRLYGDSKSLIHQYIKIE